jgi:hypothetical protein
MHALEARSGPPALRTAAAAAGMRSQLNVLQGDARLKENTKREMDTREEKAVYCNGRDMISIVLGEPGKAAI